MIVAHIAGIPVEETALSFGPVLAAGGGIAMLKVRERLSRVRRRAHRRQPSGQPSSAGPTSSSSDL
jgi:uncharacterized membrane protein